MYEEYQVMALALELRDIGSVLSMYIKIEKDIKRIGTFMVSCHNETQEKV